MNTDMVLDAPEQAIHSRGMPENVIHHSVRDGHKIAVDMRNEVLKKHDVIDVVTHIDPI